MTRIKWGCDRERERDEDTHEIFIRSLCSQFMLSIPCPCLTVHAIWYSLDGVALNFLGVCFYFSTCMHITKGTTNVLFHFTYWIIQKEIIFFFSFWSSWKSRELPFSICLCMHRASCICSDSDVHSVLKYCIWTMDNAFYFVN